MNQEERKRVTMSHEPIHYYSIRTGTRLSCLLQAVPVYPASLHPSPPNLAWPHHDTTIVSSKIYGRCCCAQKYTRTVHEGRDLNGGEGRLPIATV